MDFMWIATLLVLLVARTFVCLETEGVDFEFTSGVIIEKINENSPIFYESFIPMLFEYSLPDFSPSAMELTTYRSVSGYSGLCDKTEFDKTCPTWFYMDHLLKDQFSPNLTWWLNGNVEPLSFRGDENFCSNINGHFPPSALVTREQFNSYVQKLRLCSLGEMVNTTDFISYTRTRQDYYDTMSRNTGEAYWFLPSKVDAAAALNMQLATYAIFLLDQYMESIHWKEVYQTCKSGKIPFTIFNNDDLTNQLKKLETKLLQKNVDVNLSMPITDLNSYKNQLLADCVFTNDSTLVLRILVPVVSKKSGSHNLLQLKTIPFAKGHTGEVCFVPGLNGNTFLIEHDKKVVKTTTCKGGELCLLDSSDRDSFIENPCIANLPLYSSAVDPFRQDTNTMCPLECFKFHRESIIFQRISPDTVVIASGMVSNCFLQCPGKVDVLLSTKNVGAIRVTVPCHCAIVYNRTEQFRSKSHCRNETVITHIMPYGWEINEDEDSVTTPPGLDTTIESTLESSTTTIAPPTTENYPNEIIPESKEAATSYADRSSSNALFSIIFLMLVTIIVTLAALGYKVYKLEANSSSKRSVRSEDTACILNGDFYEAPPL